MLGLTLRDKFKGERLKGATIDFSADKANSALKKPVSEFLSITYPTLAHGALSLLEVAVPLIELSKKTNL